MTYPVFPSDLPKPIAAGYSLAVADNCNSFETDDGGHTVRRQVSRSRPGVLNMQLILNQSQFDAFNSFYDVDLEGGTSRFTMPIFGVDGSGVETWTDLTCFFANQPSFDFRDDILRYVVKSKVLFNI